MRPEPTRTGEGQALVHEQRPSSRRALFVMFLGEAATAAPSQASAPRPARRRRRGSSTMPLIVAALVAVATYVGASWAVDDRASSLPLAAPEPPSSAAAALVEDRAPAAGPDDGVGSEARDTPPADPGPRSVAAGVTATTPSSAEGAASRAAAGAPLESQPAPAAPAPPPRPSVAVHGRPVAVRVGSVGIEASMVPLGLEPTGELEVPEDFDQAGWYRHGPLPGDVGPAVVAAHVDSYRGPAAFFRLSEVRPGDGIDVEYADGTVLRFVAERVERHSKEAFPTERVYRNVPHPELRLISCGGEFDRSARSYRDNIIVWARLVEPGSP